MHNLCFFSYFFQKLLFTENYFLIAAINLATRGPLYTCLVTICNLTLCVSVMEIYRILKFDNSVFNADHW